MAFDQGDAVSWRTSRGRTEGKVVSKHTADFTFKDQQFRASDDDPVYIVESAKTGSRAAHHEDALDG